jgi:uncharacterized membrane protein YvlD (DUF360 family)
VYLVLLVAAYLIGGSAGVVPAAIVGAVVLSVVAALVRWGVRKLNSFG